MNFLEKTGFKLNPNRKVVEGILKGLQRTGGECPCHNDGATKEYRMCPCFNYRVMNECCCKLYIPDDRCFVWIARDSDNTLRLFDQKPTKCEYDWEQGLGGASFGLPEWLFPDIKWEDEEPTKMELR